MELKNKVNLSKNALPQAHFPGDKLIFAGYLEVLEEAMFKKSFLFVLAAYFLTITGTLAADSSIHPMEGVPKISMIQVSVKTNAIGRHEDGSLSFGIVGVTVTARLDPSPGGTTVRWSYIKDFASAREGRVQVLPLVDGFYEFSISPEAPAKSIFVWFGGSSKITNYPNVKVLKIDHSGVSEVKP